MISDQIALHSVQLPLCISILFQGLFQLYQVVPQWGSSRVNIGLRKRKSFSWNEVQPGQAALTSTQTKCWLLWVQELQCCLNCRNSWKYQKQQDVFSLGQSQQDLRSMKTNSYGKANQNKHKLTLETTTKGNAVSLLNSAKQTTLNNSIKNGRFNSTRSHNLVPRLILLSCRHQTTWHVKPSKTGINSSVHDIEWASPLKNSASDMTIYNTPSLPPCRVNSWNSLSALNSWTQNCLFLRFRRLSEQTRVNWLMQKL